MTAEEPRYDRGGILPSGPTLVTLTPDEHVVKPDPSGAMLCHRTDHAGHECDGAWWDHRLNLWRKIEEGP